MKLPERVALLLAGATLATAACSSNDSANSGGTSSGGTSSGGTSSGGTSSGGTSSGGSTTGGSGGSSTTGGSSSGGSGGSASGGADTGGSGGAEMGGMGGLNEMGGMGGLHEMGGMGGSDPGSLCPATTADATCVCTSELLGSGGLGGAPNPGGDVCFNYPAACGDITNFELTLGTDAGETLSASGPANLVVGLGGDDTLPSDYGDDCYVGGPGDDRLAQSFEYSTHIMMGGPGSDTFALVHPFQNEVTIVDMEADDTVALNWTNFARAAGTAGAPLGNAIEAIEAFNAGEPSTASTRIIYDPTDGELWWEDGEVSHHFATIENHENYEFDPADFVWE